MADYAFLINPDPGQIESVTADDAASAGTEAVRRAALKQQGMQGSATFRVWLVEITKLTVFDGTATVKPGVDVALTAVPLDRAL